MPDKKEADEKGKVLNLDSHGEKLHKGDRAGLIINCPSCQDVGEDHDYEVKQLEGFEKNPTAKRNHRKNLLNLMPHRGVKNSKNSVTRFISTLCLIHFAGDPPPN